VPDESDELWHTAAGAHEENAPVTETSAAEEAGRPARRGGSEEGERSPFAVALGGRLRAVRQRARLSLQAVEQSSGGKWKAVVVGSYERGDRAVTVQRLVELAEFYGVAVTELIPDPNAPQGVPRIVLDLDRLAEVPREQAMPLTRYATAIQAQRGSPGGRTLPIRVEDLRALAVIYDASPRALTDQLINWGVVGSEARSALGTP
jgi:transcriptional regulator with XRE-family HTH domain